MQATYKVTMTFLASKDDWEQGETGETGADWHESDEFSTLSEVKDFVRDRTYSGYEYIEYDSYLKRYVTAYTTTDNNEGEMSDNEKEQWKASKINGWTVSINIHVQKYTPKTIGNVKFN